MRPRYLLMILIFAFANMLTAQTSNPPSYIAHQLTEAIEVDGQMEQTWDIASWSHNWKDIVTSQDGLYRTRFKSAWDKEHLYFIIEAIDPDIRATIDTNHAPLFKYDHTIELFLDPNSDQLNYYELQINALGARWELTLDKPYAIGGRAASPDEMKDMRYAVGLNGTLNDANDIDRGWMIELAIPWKSMKHIDILSAFPQPDMRINLSRVYQDDDDVETPGQYWLWAPMGVFNIHKPELWGVLQFK